MKDKVTIGILGGGQLAKMSALEAYKLGFNISILEKEFNSPAGQLTKQEFTGWVESDKTLKEFADSCDIITLENEFIDSYRLAFLEDLGKLVIPSSSTISLIQDKLIQKTTLSKAGIPVPDFTDCNDQDYLSIKNILGSSFILKSRKMGYDGYGNAFVNSVASYKKAQEKLATRNSKLYAEKLISFLKELAIIVVRTKNEFRVYPVVETIQKNHICHTVIAPAVSRLADYFTSRQISRIIKQTEEIAIESVKAINGIGLFGIEFFLNGNGEVLVNEIAPRPHNSGHYTIDACETSQFENHIRSVLNLPLGSTSMTCKYAVMVNLLGNSSNSKKTTDYKPVLKVNNLHLHVYRKASSRPGRKMGHLTVTGDDLNEVLAAAKSAAAKIVI